MSKNAREALKPKAVRLYLDDFSQETLESMFKDLASVGHLMLYEELIQEVVYAIRRKKRAEADPD